jgi:DNA-binding CsgD family transcriptional regulator
MKSTQATLGFQYTDCEVENPPRELPAQGPSLISESATGFLLMAADYKPIYANAEAIRILLYPEAPESAERSTGILAEKIRSVILVNGHCSDHALTSEFTSGRRQYLCRAFALHLHANSGPDHPALAAILERSNRKSFDAAQVAARFHLTRREQETLQHLMQGFTNKEIGHRMNISPNTVKAFLKLIMMKMGVSTRSGIIGKTIIPGVKGRVSLAAVASHTLED